MLLSLLGCLVKSHTRLLSAFVIKWLCALNINSAVTRCSGGLGSRHEYVVRAHESTWSGRSKSVEGASTVHESDRPLKISRICSSRFLVRGYLVFVRYWTMGSFSLHETVLALSINKRNKENREVRMETKESSFLRKVSERVTQLRLKLPKLSLWQVF